MDTKKIILCYKCGCICHTIPVCGDCQKNTPQEELHKSAYSSLFKGVLCEELVLKNDFIRQHEQELPQLISSDK